MSDPLVTFNADVLMVRYQGKCKTRNGRGAVVHKCYPDQAHAQLQGAINEDTGLMFPHHWGLDGKSSPNSSGSSDDDLLMPETPLDTVYVPYSTLSFDGVTYDTEEAARESFKNDTGLLGIVTLILKSNGTVQAKANLVGPDDE